MRGFRYVGLDTLDLYLETATYVKWVELLGYFLEALIGAGNRPMQVSAAPSIFELISNGSKHFWVALSDIERFKRL